MKLQKIWANLSLKWKLLILGCVGVLVMGLSGIWLARTSNDKIEKEVEKEILAKAEVEAKRITRGLYDMVSTQDKILRAKLEGDLEAAYKYLEIRGGASLDFEKVTWSIFNQVTNSTSDQEIPKFLIGGSWIGKNYDPNVNSAVVDEINATGKIACSIFQKINKNGDMLRISSSSIAPNGKRRLGSFVPAYGSNGQPNKVVSTILSGANYVGKARVGETWMLTAYKAIKSSSGEVIGMIGVGTPMEFDGELRKSMLDLVIGKTGYAFAYGAKGNQYCVCQVHPKMEAGKNLVDYKSPDGSYLIRDIVKIGLDTKNGESKMIYYEWKNEGETKFRKKFAALTYYEPWDWVIGIGTYHDEFLDSLKKIQTSFNTSEKNLELITLFVLIAVCFVAWLVAMGIANPVNRGVQLLEAVAIEGDTSVNVNDEDKERLDIIGKLSRGIDSLVKQQQEQARLASLLAQGDWNQNVSIRSCKDELGKAMELMVDQVNEALVGVRATANEVDAGSGQISDASQSLSQGATESAASLEEISSSMTEIGSQTKANAENASQANILATETRTSAEEGNKKMSDMMNAMSDIQDSSSQIAKIIKVIDDIAFQTNLLALNAAVEAARAGRHGKGFAVVADEVRNLASRSAKAAKETSEMIESSIGKVNVGTQIAEETEKALEEIVTSSVKVADLVGEIAAASNEQAQGIAQIGQGLEQIDKVTQQNTASAEETAAAAEELSGQARELTGLLIKFKLKDNSGNSFGNTTSIGKPSYERRQIASNSSPQKNHKMLKPSDQIALDDDEFGRF